MLAAYQLGRNYGTYPHQVRRWAIVITVVTFIAFLALSTHGTPWALYGGQITVNEYALVTLIVLLVPTLMGLYDGGLERNPRAKSQWLLRRFGRPI